MYARKYHIKRNHKIPLLMLSVNIIVFIDMPHPRVTCKGSLANDDIRQTRAQANISIIIFSSDIVCYCDVLN